MSAPSREQKRRIRFEPDLQVIFLKIVIAFDARIAKHGRSQHKFEKALAIFISTTPIGRLQDLILSAWKRIYGRFKKVISNYRASDRRDTVTSRVKGNRTERELLPDGIIQHQEDHQETQRNERNERTKMESRLQKAGDRIRKAAVQRSSTVAEIDDGDEVNEGLPSVIPRSVRDRYKRRWKVVK